MRCRRTLFDLPGVVSAQPIDSLVQSMRDLIAMFIEILSVVAVIALILAVLVAYNSATISQDERTREVATMLAFGLPARRVLGSAVIESALIGVVGTAIGIVGGFVVLVWLVYWRLPRHHAGFRARPGGLAADPGHGRRARYRGRGPGPAADVAAADADEPAGDIAGGGVADPGPSWTLADGDPGAS